MKTKIRALALLLALALCTSLFAGCNSDSGNGADSTSTDGGKKEVVEITWWEYGAQPKDDSVLQALNAMSAKDIGVTVNFVFVPYADQEKLMTALSTGADDDIAFTCSWFADYVTAAQKGQFLDLTDRVKSDTPALYSSIPEYVWKGSQVNGKVYAVPVYKDTAEIYYYRVNQEYVLDGAGLQDEFKSMGAAFSTATPLLKKIKEYNEAGNAYPGGLSAPLSLDQGGMKGIYGGWDILSPILIGRRLTGDSYQIDSFLRDEAFIDDLKTLSEWYRAGYINQDAPNITQNPGFYVFDNEQGYEGAEAEWNVGLDFHVAIQQRTQPVASSSTVTGAMNGIFTNSKHPDEALKYLEYINTNKDYRNMLAYGIEGKNWELNNGAAKILNTDYSMSPWAQANLFLCYPPDPAPADMYEKVEAQMHNPETSDLLGFAFDMANVRNEVGACTTVMQKYISILLCGSSKDVDATVAQMLDEMNQNGYQKVIDECQRQVDEFLGK